MRRATAIATALLAAGCARHLEPSMVPTETRSYATDDGWTGELRRYGGSGPPVLLVHGMGANHYNWDFRPEVSLAAWLQERGYDVWVPALRGDGGAEAPSRRARRSVDFDQLAVHDVPAILDAVEAATGAPTVAWVGHSMGGMLLYTTLAQWPERVSAGVAIASPATFPEPRALHRAVGRMGFALHGRGVFPSAALGRASVALFGLRNPMLGRIAVVENLDPATGRGLVRVALADLPRPMARQAAAWMKSGAITRVDGTPWVAAGPDVPLLALGASADRVVPAGNVEASCALFPACTYTELGPAGGFPRDYGHVDAVLGTMAADEVYPLVGAFLDAHAP